MWFIYLLFLISKILSLLCILLSCCSGLLFPVCTRALCHAEASSSITNHTWWVELRTLLHFSHSTQTTDCNSYNSICIKNVTESPGFLLLLNLPSTKLNLAQKSRKVNWRMSSCFLLSVYIRRLYMALSAVCHAHIIYGGTANSFPPVYL